MEYSDNYFLLGKNIYLRAFQPGDEQMIAHLENHPDPRDTLFYAFPTSPEDQLEVNSRLKKDHSTLVFTICNREHNKPIGQSKLVRIDWVGRMATFYLGFAYKADWGKGYGNEVVRLMLTYAFNTLNLNRIQLHVAKKNQAAIRVYEKNGFKTEGKLREAMFYEGKYWDFYLMAILKRNFV